MDTITLEAACHHASIADETNSEAVTDCLAILQFIEQQYDDKNFGAINKFLADVKTNGTILGRVASLRYSWLTRDRHPQWYRLRDHTYQCIVIAKRDPERLLKGLVDLKP